MANNKMNIEGKNYSDIPVWPLYVAGDLPGLTGLTLEDMQRDITC